ncbi:MAG TPA: hypothetical protein VHB01_04270 [Nitrosospira sp.]|nr:hypothetical protein [Nitrosospira sp.]
MQVTMLPVLLASLLMPLAIPHVNAASLPDRNDSASDAGKYSCPKKLSRGEPDSMPLPPSALAKLDARGGFGYGIFSGTLHNADPEYTVTQVTLLITPTGKPIPTGSETGREYDLPLALKPDSTSSLSMLLPSDHTQEYSWKITKACGYKVR